MANEVVNTEVLEATDIVDTVEETGCKIGWKQIGIAGATIFGGIILYKKVIKPQAKKLIGKIKANKTQKKAETNKSTEEFDIQNMKVDDLPSVD